MDAQRARDLSCPAKLAHVVLENCGPLAPTEVAREARLSDEQAAAGVAELVGHGFARPVCGVCSAREDVYELVDGDDRDDGDERRA